MSFVVQLRVCNASSKAKAAMRNAAWFQRRRIPRSRFYRISIELSIDFYRNRFTSALRQCDAKFNCAFAMQVQRQKPSCATPDASVGKQASCGAQLERVVGRGRPRASLSGEMASRNLVRSDGSGAVIWRVVVRCCTAWVDVGGLMGQERAQLVVVLFEYLALADSF